MYYFSIDQKQIQFHPDEIREAYSKGYLLTRLGKGIVTQTRSLRIDLDDFILSSENKRILRKTEGIEHTLKELPLDNYSWEIHKLGKDFYSRKFGAKTMSASKIKSMFNDLESENMTHVIEYTLDQEIVGYALIYLDSRIMHYSYPFYNLDLDVPNLGMGMMIRAVQLAQDKDLEYVYLGSVTTPESKYKLQFEGLEWFNTTGFKWDKDLSKLKSLLDS